MIRTEQYRKIYESSFSDSAVWIDWMMRQVCTDSDLMLLDDENGTKAVSALLLRRYGWQYFGSRLDMSYIYGACTLPRYRARGYMGRLIDTALRRALERGDALCTLIPASGSLCDYYGHFGFARAVYADCERYTSAHCFDTSGVYTAAMPGYADFQRLESSYDNTVLHSEAEYHNVVDDIHLDGGGLFAVSSGDAPVSAMAFAVPYHDSVIVKALYASDNAAKDAVLAQVQERLGQHTMAVYCFPDGGSIRRPLQLRGMVRLLDVFQLLNAMAACDPSLRCTLRVRDRRIPGNADRFTITDGICYRGGGSSDLDVDISTLANILGSSESIGRIMGLRTTRYRLPLMLD